jgi:hypothetical protein
MKYLSIILFVSLLLLLACSNTGPEQHGIPSMYVKADSLIYLDSTFYHDSVNNISIPNKIVLIKSVQTIVSPSNVISNIQMVDLADPQKCDSAGGQVFLEAEAEFDINDDYKPDAGDIIATATINTYSSPGDTLVSFDTNSLVAGGSVLCCTSGDLGSICGNAFANVTNNMISISFPNIYGVTKMTPVRYYVSYTNAHYQGFVGHYP